MYDVNNYGGMMVDPVRMSAFTRALRTVVKPGCVVVDVGTGLGVLSLLAAKFGARKVYAIETNPCIHLGREMAKRNGFGDRIEFIHKSVFDVELAERADVLVSDCRGHFPLYQRNLEIVAFARDHFLAEGGVIVSQCDEMFVSLTEEPKLRRTMEAPWTVGGFDWDVCRQEALSTPVVAGGPDLDRSTHLTDPMLWSTIDYRTVTSPDVHGSVDGVVRAGGSAQFLCLWFRATALEGIHYGPGIEGSDVYRPLMLPLNPPIEVAAGEAVHVRIDALRSKEGYCFAWNVKTPRQQRRQAGDGLGMAPFSKGPPSLRKDAS